MTLIQTYNKHGLKIFLKTHMKKTIQKRYYNQFTGDIQEQTYFRSKH